MLPRRLGRLLALAGIYLGLGYGIHRSAPPAPRCVLDGPPMGRISPDGGSFVSGFLINQIGFPEAAKGGSGPIDVYDTSTGQLRKSYGKDGEYLQIPIFCDQQRFLALIQKGQGHVIDLKAEREWTIPVPELEDLDNPPWFDIRSSADGRFFVLRFEPDVLLLVDNGHVTRLAQPEVAHGVECAFSPDGRWFLYRMGNNEGTAVWNLHERRLHKVVPGMAGPYRFTADGKSLATLFRYRRPALWNLPAFTCRAVVSLEPCEAGEVPSIDLSPDDRWLAIVMNRLHGAAAHVEFRNVVTGERTGVLTEGPTSRIWLAGFAPTGDAAALLSHEGRKLTVVALPSAKVLWRQDIPGPAWMVGGCCGPAIPLTFPLKVGASRTLIIDHLQRGEIHCLDWHTGKLRGWFRRPRGPAAVALCADHQAGDLIYVQPKDAPPPPPPWFDWLERWLPESRWNRSFLVIDVPSGQPVLSIQRPDSTGAEISKDGRTLMTSRPLEDPSGMLYRHEFWDVPARPRWTVILGVPAAFLGLLTAGPLICRKRRA
jgi:hypothetical protein